MSKVFGIMGPMPDTSRVPSPLESVQKMKHTGALVDGIELKLPQFHLATLSYRGQKHSGLASAPDGSVHLFVHGEIYEKNIYHTEDSEKAIRGLLDDYQKNGLDALRDLNGSYTAIVYEPAERVLHFVTDRFVIKKIYWHMDNQTGRFVFSSEIWPLLQYLDQKAPDYEGVADLLTLGYLTGTRTLVRDVNILDPAETTTVVNSTVTCERYWDWTYQHDNETSVSDTADQFHELLKESVDYSTRSGNRIIINLSGGKDSRFLCAHAHAMGRPFTSLNYGHPGCDDVRYAVMAAKVMGVQLAQLPFPDDFVWRHLDRTTLLYNGSTPIEQGFHLIETEDKDDEGDLPVLVNGHMGCVVSGLHFSGFNHLAGVFKNEPAPLRWPRLNLVDAPMSDDAVRYQLGMFCRRFQPGSLKELVTDLRILEEAPRVIDRQWEPARGHDFDLVQWFMQYVDCTQRQDRWTASVLELLSNTCIVRCPFASPAIYDLSDRLSSQTMLNQKSYKLMFHRYFPKLARIPTPDGRAATSDFLEKVYGVRWAVERKVKRLAREYGIDRRPWAPTYIDYNTQIVSRYDDYSNFLTENKGAVSRWFDEKAVHNYLQGIRDNPDPERRVDQRFFSLISLILAERDLFS